MYFDRANNYWVAAVSLGHKAGKRVRRKVTGRTRRKSRPSSGSCAATWTAASGPARPTRSATALDDWLANGLSGRSDRTKELYRDTVKPLRRAAG